VGEFATLKLSDVAQAGAPVESLPQILKITTPTAPEQSVALLHVPTLSSALSQVTWYEVPGGAEGTRLGVLPLPPTIVAPDTTGTVSELSGYTWNWFAVNVFDDGPITRNLIGICPLSAATSEIGSISRLTALRLH
jgi:hypothetical protein